MKKLLLVVAVGLLLGADAKKADPPAQADKTRNPFGVADVPDPDGKDVQELADKTTLPGDAKDANAEQWVKDATAGKKGSLEGEWSDRWNGPAGGWYYGTDRTKIKVVGDRVYFLVNASNGKFLIDACRKKNRLVGRWQGIDNPNDAGPCVFVVVDDERIDGNWAGAGRWDFRRKIK